MKTTELEKNKIFYKNNKDVGIAQKGQKQEGMSCGEVNEKCFWAIHAT